MQMTASYQGRLANPVLAHRVSWFPRRWRLSEIQTSGPATGRAKFEARCRVCGRSVRCTIASRQTWRRRMLHRLAALWGVDVVGLGAIITWFSARPGDTGLPIVAAVFFAGVMLPATFFGTLHLRDEASDGHGIRLRHRSRRHSIRTRASLVLREKDIWQKEVSHEFHEGM
jgi:hypothetical protein